MKHIIQPKLLTIFTLILLSGSVFSHENDDVLILEGKGVERSAQEYASHHMLSDMKYLKAMTIESIEHHVTQFDVVAISISRSSVKGTYKDKNIDRIGNETIALKKHDDKWKITHIHWSN